MAEQLSVAVEGSKGVCCQRYVELLPAETAKGPLTDETARRGLGRRQKERAVPQRWCEETGHSEPGMAIAKLVVAPDLETRLVWELQMLELARLWPELAWGEAAWSRLEDHIAEQVVPEVTVSVASEALHLAPAPAPAMAMATASPPMTGADPEAAALVP